MLIVATLLIIANFCAFANLTCKKLAASGDSISPLISLSILLLGLDHTTLARQTGYMSNKAPHAKADRQAAKKARLAQALRANLQRRKAGRKAAHKESRKAAHKETHKQKTIETNKRNK